MIIFTPQNTVLALTGLINLAMGIFILSRGQRNRVNLYFSLVTLANFFWTFSLFFWYLAWSDQVLRLFSGLPYTFAWLVVVSLFYFTINFPYKSLKYSIFFNYFIIVVSVAIVAYTTFFNKYFVRVADLNTNSVYYDQWGHLIYSILLILLILASIMVLFKKYKVAEGIFKFQLKLILIGVLVGTIFGCYFNLILYYFGGFKYDWFGPIFTLIISIVVFYFIYSSKDKIHA